MDPENYGIYSIERRGLLCILEFSRPEISYRKIEESTSYNKIKKIKISFKRY